MKFFKERIEMQYPLAEVEDDPFLSKKEAHEAFMKSRAEMVLGREKLLKQVSSNENPTGIIKVKEICLYSSLFPAKSTFLLCNISPSVSFSCR